MEDYQGNAKRQQDKKTEDKPVKVVEKVVVGEVVIRKKTLGQKFKEIFVGDDAKSVIHYVFISVLVPAARDMIVDATTKGMRRMVYGDDTPMRRGPGYTPQNGSRVVYNSPMRRDPRDIPRGPQYRTNEPVRSGNEYIISSREEADLVLEKMYDIVSQYGLVTMADLNELVGYPATHIDNKWGWTYLTGTTIRQSRDGWVIDFPPAEPIG